MTEPADGAKRRTIGVVGAGSIGTGLCVDLLLHGMDVVLVDVSQDQLDEALQSVAQTARFAPMLRRDLPSLTPDEIAAALQTTTELGAVAGCEFVVENVVEDWEVKRDVYRELDALAAPEARFGVNTSSIPIGRVAAETSRPDRIVGIHFMNPPYLKEAVEVIRGADTSEETLEYVHDLLASMGKEGIVVGDFPGFVSNRISHLFFNEAARVVEEQGVEPATVDRLFKKCFGHAMGPLETADLIGLDTVDRLFKKCFGHAMGPLETADLIGLDTVALTLDSLHASYGDDRFVCAALLRELVRDGKLGKKSGQGFYEYR